jgi:hypothetical protein
VRASARNSSLIFPTRKTTQSSTSGTVFEKERGKAMITITAICIITFAILTICYFALDVVEESDNTDKRNRGEKIR